MNLLTKNKFTWLVTGAAGFIGSNIAESLLKSNQKVIAIDNFATGYQSNLEPLKKYGDFNFLEIDIKSNQVHEKLSGLGIDYILHQAALGSVPRSIENPIASHEANVSGFINMIEFAKSIQCKKFVYASSSAVYGDDETLPKTEASIGEPLSPYAATKRINEVYANTYLQTYGLESVGLRYFNVFGKRQDPQGAYAAVIPKWIELLKSGEQITIYGNGSNTTRDYCHVSDVVQANIKAALCDSKDSLILNIGTGEKTDLNSLANGIISEMNSLGLKVNSKINYEEMRAGDIVHSVADISRAKESIDYKPEVTLTEGLKETIQFFTNL